MSLPHPSLTEFIRAKDVTNLTKILITLSPFEIADTLDCKDEEECVPIIEALPPTLMAETYKYLSKKIQKLILQVYPMDKIVSMIKNMETDDSIALLKNLPKKAAYNFVKQLPNDDQVEILELLGYPKGSVGRLMTTNFISSQMGETIEQVIENIRQGDKKAGSEIYITNDLGILDNIINIKQLFSLPKEKKVDHLKRKKKMITLPILDSQENAIQIFKKHGLFEIPVVDDNRILHGVVTMDDILRLASDLNTSRIQKIGGTEALDESYTDTPFFNLIKKRVKWLILLFLGEMFTATAMGYFEDEISKAVVLALFLPLIISSGGNAGSQSSTLIIRAMALGEVKLKDWWRIMRWEILAGFLLGCVLGIVGFARVTIWSSFSNIYGVHWLMIAVTISLALIGVVLWGSLMGAMLPFILRRAGVDPATSSAPLVATLVDVTGIIIYFHIAMWVLKGILL
jgi:magnesium transporter